MKMLSGFKSSRLNGVIRAVLISLVTFLLIFVLILAGISPDTYDIHIGEPASKTVYATKDVEDTVTTEQLRVAAANAVEPSYKSVDTSVNGVVLDDMKLNFDALLSIKAQWQDKLPGNATEAQLSQINETAPFTLSQDILAALLRTDRPLLQEVFDAGTAKVRDTLSSTLPEGQESSAVTRITRDLVDDKYPTGAVSLVSEILRISIQPNMLIDTEITEANRQKARDAVEP